jgi:chromosome partitioning protein
MAAYMQTVALLARKGGAGKTTCAIHMGALAQAGGQRVLFFDLDPQRSLATWWQSRAADTPPLIETDPARLADLLGEADREGYDLAVVDTPPAVTFDTARVAALASLVLIPLRPSILDIYAVESTAAVVRTTRTPAILVLNACMPPTGAGEAPTTLEARAALKGMTLPVAATALAQRMDYARALNSGEAVTEFAPASKAAAEITRLWHEVHQEMSHDPQTDRSRRCDGEEARAGAAGA